MNIQLYGINNFSGVKIPGLKDSVYKIKEVYDNDLEILEEDPSINISHPKLINLGRVSDINKKAFEFADKILENGKSPLLFAGDHSIAIGSISATAKHFDNVGVIWIDAHADINTEATTPSGNIHGMPLAFLLGDGTPELSEIGSFKPKLKAENIIYLGLRSVDPGEKEIIKDLGITAYYYDEIAERGIDAVLEESLKKFENLSNIHLSFDFDSMEPSVFPAVTTDVVGGFSQEEVFAIFKAFLETEKVRSIDLVEFNYSRDEDDKSLKFAIELLDFIKDNFR